MTAEQFKQIRTYLNDQRYKGQKWSMESLGRALLSTRQTVDRWESGKTEVPKMVAERLQEMMHECGLEKVQTHLKKIMKSKVHTPRELEQFLEKVSNI